MKVLYIEPMRSPRVIDIPNTLEAKQELVGGYIEGTYPFDDPVALVCNEEGKLQHLPLNRAVFEISDIISGPFFICGVDDYDFTDIPEDLIEKYTERFLYPERFYSTPEGFAVVEIRGQVCSRCGRRYFSPPAISRSDNHSPVCARCGTEEALIAAGIDKVEALLKEMYGDEPE